MEKILIIGAGGFGKELVDLVNNIGSYDIIGFLDDDEGKKGKLINGIPVLGSLKELPLYRSASNLALAAANPVLKQRFYEYSKPYGFHYPNLIHPTVIFGSKADVGMGNILCANTIISTEVRIRDFVSINPQCGIGHECELHSFSTLYWGVHIGGNTVIESYCELGTSSTIIQGLNIAANVRLGAGAVVVKDIIERGTYVGVPAVSLTSLRQ